MTLREAITDLHESLQSRQSQLYALAAVSCFVFVFITVPIGLTSLEDNVDGMSGYLSYFAINSLIATAVFVCIAAAVYRISGAKARAVLTLLLVWLTSLAVVDAFLLQKDYGVLDNFVFAKTGQLVPSWQSGLIDAAAMVSLFALTYWLLVRKKAVVSNALAIFLLTNLGMVGVGAVKIQHRTGKTAQAVPKQIPTLFNYSKTGRNVVLFFLDGAMSGFLPDIFAADPSLTERYDGFSWYSNVVSTGNRTINGMPSLFGGYDYTVSEINKRKGPLKEKVSEAYYLYADNFTSKGYDVLYADPFWFGFERTGDAELFNKYNKGRCIHSIGAFMPPKEYSPEKKQELFKGLKKQYAVLSVFKVVPASLRNWVYGDGKWLGCSYAWKKKEDKYLRNYYSLEHLGNFSGTTSPKDTFTFIANEITRAPSLLRENNLPDHTLKASPESLKKYKDESTTAIYETTRVGVQMLAKYMDWFKRNGIYDNTMFVVVSDHGWTSHDPVLNNNVDQKTYSMFQSFLMVKPFGASGSATESKEFIVNASVPGIICDTIGGCTDQYTGKKVTYQKVSGPVLLHETPWQPSGQNADSYVVDKKYEVRDDITRPENWKKL